MGELTNFTGIFAILFEFLIDPTPRLRSTATPPRVRLMPTSHRLTLRPRPHHFGPMARPFHEFHEVLQHVRFASEDPPVLPFDWIQFRLARVDLDRRTSSVARAPASS